MATYKREDVKKAFQAIQKGQRSPVYLVIGDRYLGQRLAAELARQLIPDDEQRRQNLKLIDGDQERPLNTLGLLKTYSLFPGRQIFKVTDSRLFHSKEVARPLWDKAEKAAAAKDLKKAGRYLRQFLNLAKTPLEDPAELPTLDQEGWKAAFGFVRPDSDLAWIGEAVSLGHLQAKGSTPPATQAADQYMETFTAGIPENNILILLAEEVDKRKKFYKFIHKNGVIFDLAVATGASKAAKADQEKLLRDLIVKTLGEFGKTMEARALPVFLERVGFHPVALVRETEKLALYSGDNPTVTLADLEAVVGRTREEAVFELTEAYTEGNLPRALIISSRMLESGLHPLIMVSAIRNQLRKLLLISSFRRQPSPAFTPGMNFSLFQKGYLPQLKEEKGELLKSLPNHPYALFMMFERAAKHSAAQLMKAQKKLLEAEYRLKSTPLPAALVFENFLFEMLAKEARP